MFYIFLKRIFSPIVNVARIFLKIATKFEVQGQEKLGTFLKPYKTRGRHNSLHSGL